MSEQSLGISQLEAMHAALEAIAPRKTTPHSFRMHETTWRAIEHNFTPKSVSVPGLPFSAIPFDSMAVHLSGEVAYGIIGVLNRDGEVIKTICLVPESPDDAANPKP